MVEGYPTSLKALTLQKPAEPRKPVYNDVRIVEKSIPVLKRGEVLVRINWIRKGQYPGIVFDSTLGADGAGECSLLRAHIYASYPIAISQGLSSPRTTIETSS